MKLPPTELIAGKSPFSRFLCASDGDGRNFSVLFRKHFSSSYIDAVNAGKLLEEALKAICQFIHTEFHTFLLCQAKHKRWFYKKSTYHAFDF